jgi:hypothetical protein
MLSIPAHRTQITDNVHSTHTAKQRIDAGPSTGLLQSPGWGSEGRGE